MCVTLLQTRCNAVFLSTSCRSRFALALLTNTSAAHEWRWLCQTFGKQRPILCVSGDVLTYSIGLSILSCHHEWCPACVCVNYVHLSSMAQKKRNTLHMVRKSCSVKRGPGLTQTYVTNRASAHPENLLQKCDVM